MYTQNHILSKARSFSERHVRKLKKFPNLWKQTF